MTTQSVQPATFGETLLHALEQFTNPVALGRTSPLATPYLLGHHLPASETDARARGRVLQQLLQSAVAAMSGEDADLHRAIIEERYFKGKSAAAARDTARIALGKTQYFEHQKRAILQLEPHLLDQLNPTLRLEQPLLQAGELLDRDRVVARCLAALTQRQTVMLTGPGGVGKTSLGSRLAEVWGNEVFWFTVRPGINDHLHRFLFELAYFCRLRGAAWLWQELIANNGYLPAARIPAIVRHTLVALPTVPLLCLDEADLLLTTTDGAGADSQARPLSELLAGLRTLVPILAMGQRAAIDADHQEPLTTLSPPLSNVLLKRHQINLPAPEQEQLYRYTSGNPRLLHLLIALHQSGEPLPDLLGQLSHAPSLHFLLARILQRLDETAIGVLLEVAIFAVAAPVDQWQTDPARFTALQTLYTRRLIQLDQAGGVALLPAYRDAIVAELPIQKAAQLHANAAAIFQRRGRYTLAAQHLSHTTEPERAVWFWRDLQQAEINGGQAYPALKLFRAMQQLPLSVAAREQVVLYCAALEKVVGTDAAALAELRSILIKTPLLQVEADTLGGLLANDRGDLTTAEQLFRRAIGEAEQLLSVRLAHAYKGLGWRYRNERALEQAWRQGLLAQYEVANFQGEVQFNRRIYEQAIAHWQEALRLAEQLDHTSGIAKSANNLGRCHATIGHYTEADGYFDRAEAIYRQIGKVTVFDGMAVNRAFVWNLAGRYTDAVSLLQNLLVDKVQRGESTSPELTALIYQNLAEALLGLGHLVEAEQAVQEAIDQEEVNVSPDALRTHGEIKLQQGFPEQAERLICRALTLIDQFETPDPYLAGYAWRALMQVYCATGDNQKVQAAYEKAVDCFATMNLSHEIDKTTRLM